MEKKRIKINDVEYTSWCPSAGYEVSTKYVYGANKMTMQNGGEFKDEVANMSIVEVPFMPLTDAQISALTQNLHTSQTCKVWFFDPDTNAYRTIRANRSIAKRKGRGTGADGNYYWTPVVATFEECNL